ncbi:hypothetical protein [Polaromonas jejuensis]|uniref:Transmembrane protein n=1 Tax=Polaromonas jejuensis TaxID=457502 RepID=A0ABW0Q3K5_9BURK|nr:hypothetical protein [Polaromonas jejuensis]
MKAGLTTRLTQACRWGGLIGLGIGYALLSHLAAASAVHSLPGALVAMAPMLVLAFLIAWRSDRRALMLGLWLAGCTVLYAIKGWLIAHYHWVFLLEHAGTYSLLCATFGQTLQNGQTPMISRFARIVHGSLSPALVRYTRSATWAWVLYFGGIAGLSLLLFWLAPIGIWSAFAYLLGIPLLVLMFAGEYAARCCLLPPADRAGPLEAIQAYRQASSEGKARPRHTP